MPILLRTVVLAAGLLAPLALSASTTPVQTLEADAALQPWPSLTLPLDPAQPQLELRRSAPGGCLLLRYRSEDADGQRFEACLEQGAQVVACLELPPSGGAWKTVPLWLPGVEGLPGFPGKPSLVLWASALRLRPLSAGHGKTLRLELAELRLGQSAPGSPAASLAAAFACSEADVEAARALDLPEPLVWTLLELQRHCACPLSALTAARATQSWGEIAVAYGQDWAALNERVWRQARAAGLFNPAPSQQQRERALRNDAFGAKP